MHQKSLEEGTWDYFHMCLILYTHIHYTTHTYVEREKTKKEKNKKRKKKKRELGESSTQAIGNHWKLIKLKER